MLNFALYIEPFRAIFGLFYHPCESMMSSKTSDVAAEDDLCTETHDRIINGDRFLCAFHFCFHAIYQFIGICN